MSLDELLRAAQAGDSRAEQRLYRQLRIDLLPFFKTHGDWFEVEDLIQETLSFVAKALQEKHFVSRGPTSFRAYVFVVARYRLWTHRKEVRRHRRNAGSEGSWAFSSSEASPDEVTLSLQEATLLQAAMAKLKTSYRRALESRASGQDPHEFAHAEGVELGTVRTRIYRALELVKAEIEAQRRTARSPTPT